MSVSAECLQISRRNLRSAGSRFSLTILHRAPNNIHGYGHVEACAAHPQPSPKPTTQTEMLYIVLSHRPLPLVSQAAFALSVMPSLSSSCSRELSIRIAHHVGINSRMTDQVATMNDGALTTEIVPVRSKRERGCE